MAYFYFKGVKLPEIPPEVVEAYSHFAVLDETYSTQRYVLIAATEPIYVYDEVKLASENGLAIYRTPENDFSEWVHAETANVYATLETVDGSIKSPVWTNANIMSGSGTSGIVAYYADSLPVNAEELFQISRETLEGFAEAARKKSGESWLLSPEKMLSILSADEGTSTESTLPEKVVYYNNMNGFEYSTINTKKISYDGTTNTIMDDFDKSDKWADAAVAVMKDDSSSKEIAFQRTYSDTDETHKRWTDNGLDSGDWPGFTVGGWFCRKKLSGTYERAIFFYGSKAFGLYFAPGSSYLKIDVAGSAHSVFKPSANDEWYHFAISVEPTSGKDGYVTVSVYVNSKPKLSVSGEHEMSFVHLSIGCVGSYPWPGNVKNIFLSKGVLTREEIRQMMLRD